MKNERSEFWVTELERSDNEGTSVSSHFVPRNNIRFL